MTSVPGPARSSSFGPLGALGTIGVIALIGIVSPPALAADAARAGAVAATGAAEVVTVTATRLPGKEEETGDVPAHVTVITRERIEESGSRTLQDLLRFEAGILLYDQIGNGIEQTLDLRGFTSGTGIAVFVDGARMNDPRNNTLALDLVPIDAVERVEIIRGSTAALAGGGSEAGVIHITTRRGGEIERSDAPTGRFSAAVGTHETQQLRASGGTSSGQKYDVFGSVTREETDGFRANGGAERTRAALQVGWSPDDSRRVSISILATEAEYDAPGALTEIELDASRTQSPFNRADGSDTDFRQAALNYRRALSDTATVSANVFYREQDRTSLSTGRSAPAFGGFYLETDSETVGSTVQLTRTEDRDRKSNSITIGLEWLEGNSEDLGIFTSPSNPSRIDTSDPDSFNKTERRSISAYIQESYRPSPEVNFTLGMRYDRDKLSYDEAISAPRPSDSRTFEETSYRVGAALNRHPMLGFYMAYGESFLAPTTEQLFAFPGFGSNAKLDPQDSRTIEAGVRGDLLDGTGGSYSVTLFRIRTKDEIVFDPGDTSGSNPFGTNVNRGKTQRTGVEGSLRGRLTKGLTVHLSLTLMDAEFDSGDFLGHRVPLVPEEQIAGGVVLRLPGFFSVHLDGLYVGDLILDSDESNRRGSVGSRFVADLRSRWWIGPGKVKGEGLTLFAEWRNVLDEEYASRGIFAFDFSGGKDAAFFTPSDGRAWLAGAEWSF